jgi:hypothetical protein
VGLDPDLLGPTRTRDGFGEGGDRFEVMENIGSFSSMK